MKAKSVVSVVLVMCLAMGTCAFAASQGQPNLQEGEVIAQRGKFRDGGRYELRRDRVRNEDVRRSNRRGDRISDRHSNWRDHRYGRRNDRIHYRYNRRQASRGYYRRGAGPWHDLYKGKHLPRYYRSRHYRIHNWRGHGLYAPPRGQYWAQVGADYVLVAITTAVIFDLILHR